MILLLGDIGGSTNGKSTTTNLNNIFYDNQSHYSLDVIEFRLKSITLGGYYRNE